EDQVSTDKLKVSTNKPKVSTDKPDEGTAEPKDGNLDESAAPIFKDDETIVEFLVSIPLPKIDPKDKGKKVLEEEAESDAELEGVNESKRKFAQLATNEEIARKVQEEWEAEEEKKMLAEEEATKAVLIRDYDDIQARIDADRILAIRLQEEERENFTIEERAKFLHDTIAAQKRFLAQQRAAEIRNLNFIAIGSAEDERLIRDLNKKAVGIKKADSIKEESKEEEAPDEDKEVDYEILDKKYPIIEWKSECLGTKPQYDETKDIEEINLNVVIRSNGQKRYFSFLIRVLSIFDREDLCVVYQLVMDRYQNEIPKGFDIVLLGDLMIMFNISDEDKFWNSQQDWNVYYGKYPLRKKVLVQMLELKLESEEDNIMALELIRFVKKLIVELEPENSDGDEKDL
ncbi:hypothetical protein Tco_0190217, partial [Tanacetum coccineum]